MSKACPVASALPCGRRSGLMAFALAASVHVAVAAALAYQNGPSTHAEAQGPVTLAVASFSLPSSPGPQSDIPDTTTEQSSPVSQSELGAPMPDANETETEPQEEVPPAPPEESELSSTEREPSKPSEETDFAHASFSSEAAGSSSMPEGEPTESQETFDTGSSERLSEQLAQSRGAKVSWEGRLQAHLQRHKRYPYAARSRREEGVALVRFQMNREGRLLTNSLERSSGSVLLDREVKQLLKRAQPMPKPPREIVGDRVEVVLPIEFSLR